MNDSPRPPVSPRRPKQESSLGTMLAVMGVLFLAGGFCGLMGIATGGGFFFVIPLLIIAVAFLGMFHYVVWGRALSRLRAEAEEERGDAAD